MWFASIWKLASLHFWMKTQILVSVEGFQVLGQFLLNSLRVHDRYDLGSSPAFFFRHFGDHHPKEYLASSVEPDLKLGTCRHMVNSFMGCNQILQKFQESKKQYYFLLTFLGAILHQFARGKKKG